MSPKVFPHHMREIALSMLSLSPPDRPSCADLSEYDWFTDCGVTNLTSAHEVTSTELSSLE